MSVRVNIRFGHLDRMPLCEHGRIEGFCRSYDVQAIEAQRAETTEIGSVGDESAAPKGCTQRRAA